MGKIITLAKPNLSSSMPLERAIAARRSHRNLLGQPLSLEQIGQLLWSGQGLASGGKYRTAPSAGATYPLELYAVTNKALYHYLPDKHALDELSQNDLRGELCSAAWGQSFVKVAPLTIVIAADFSRTTDYYRKRGIRYVYIEAGHVAQNIYLQGESLGLGSVSVGAFDDAAVSKVLSLPDNLLPVYMVTTGYYDKPV